MSRCVRVLSVALTVGSGMAISVPDMAGHSPAVAQTVTVGWSTQPGTAMAGMDYVSGSGTVTVASGETTKAVTVVAKSDSITPERNETLFVSLSNPENATVADGQGQGTSFEQFTVELSAPSGATLLKPIGTCTILNDDVMTASPPVSRLVVVSDGDAALGRNRLQWVSPDPVTLEPSAQTVGPPALDIGLSPDPNMIYVGSGQGALYAVEASF